MHVESPARHLAGELQICCVKVLRVSVVFLRSMRTYHPILVKWPGFLLTLALGWLVSGQLVQAAESRLEGEVERYVKSLRKKGALQTVQGPVPLFTRFSRGRPPASQPRQDKPRQDKTRQDQTP